MSVPGRLLPKQFNSSIGSAHMKQRNKKLVTGLSAAMLLMGANVALAETRNVPATVTVNNAINFTFTGSLNFGQVRAKASPLVSECVGLVMSANPATAFAAASAGTMFTAACTGAGTGANAAVVQAVGGTPARPVFTVAGVAPFTNLTLTLPTTAVNLTAATGPNTAQFQLVDFTAYKTSGTAGNVPTTAGGLITDATGGAVFNVGATLITDPTAVTTATYQDLAYTGNFDVIVNY
jgi:mannose/fructose-specific phosphotransferase system component IIA